MNGARGSRCARHTCGAWVGRSPDDVERASGKFAKPTVLILHKTVGQALVISLTAMWDTDITIKPASPRIESCPCGFGWMSVRSSESILSTPRVGCTKPF